MTAISPASTDQDSSALVRRMIACGFWTVLFVVPLALTTYALPESLKWLILATAAPVLAAAWLLHRVFTGGEIRMDAILWAVLATLIAQAVSMPAATNQGLSLVDLTRHLALASMCLLAARALTNGRDRDRTLWIVAVCSLLVAIYGIAQHFGFDFFPWQQHVEVPTRRGVSTIGHPTFAASFQIMAIPLAVALALTRTSRCASGFAFAIVAAQLTHMLVTGARGPALGLAAAAVALLIALAVSRPPGTLRPAVALSLAAAIALASALVYAAWREKKSDVLAVGEGGMSMRIYTWETASRLFLRHPVVGVGAGNYAVASPAYWNEQEAARYMQHNRYSSEVHNEYLEIAAEQGLLGLGAFMALAVASLAGALRVARNAAVPRERVLGWGLFAALVAAYVDALGIFNLQVAAPAVLFWSILGLVSSLRSQVTSAVA